MRCPCFANRWREMTLLSGDLEAADILHSSRPPATLSTRYGPGGPNRELGQSFVDSGIPEPVARGIPLAQEEVASAFRKARKMQVSHE